MNIIERTLARIGYVKAVVMPVVPTPEPPPTPAPVIEVGSIDVAITYWETRENEKRNITGDMDYAEYLALVATVNGSQPSRSRADLQTFKMVMDGRRAEVTFPVYKIMAVVAVLPGAKDKVQNG